MLEMENGDGGGWIDVFTLQSTANTVHKSDSSTFKICNYSLSFIAIQATVYSYKRSLFFCYGIRILYQVSWVDRQLRYTFLLLAHQKTVNRNKIGTKHKLHRKLCG